MLDESLTTGAVTDIAGRVGGAVSAGLSSHAAASTSTARGISTVRFTGHLRETSNARSMGRRKGRARCGVDTPSTEGRVVDGYNLWTSPSRRGPGGAQRRGVGADHRVCGSRTNRGGRG